MSFKKPGKGGVFTTVFFLLMIGGVTAAGIDVERSSKAEAAIAFEKMASTKTLNRETPNVKPDDIAALASKPAAETSTKVVSNRARFKKGVWEVSQWRDDFTKTDMSIKCLYSDRQIINNVAGYAMPLEEREMLCIRSTRGGKYDVFVRLHFQFMTEYTGVGHGNFRFDSKDGTSDFKSYYVGRNSNWDYPGAIVMESSDGNLEELAARIEASKSVSFKIMLMDGRVQTLIFSNPTGNRFIEKVPYE